ncbi:MAG: hypothetical protein QNK23_10150 [Crocinitomicaceae bacterium]|nr:hypothetical protein [Crocinitomicaceae bacterium]
MKKLSTYFIISTLIISVIIGTTLQGGSLVNSEWNNVMADFQNWKSFLLS